jgi:hypothetical protein
MDPSKGEPESLTTHEQVDDALESGDTAQNARTALLNEDEKSRDTGSEEEGAPEEKIPALLELSLKFLDIKKTFGIESLKALRLTSRAARDLLDDAGALAGFAFDGDNARAQLNEYLNNDRAIQRVQSILFDQAHLNHEEGSKFLLQEPPKLARLDIYRTNVGTDAVLLGKFPHLTCLHLSNISREFPWELLANARFPLQELSLYSADVEITAGQIIAILNNFSELRTLTLKAIKINRHGSNLRILPTSLEKVEVIELTGVSGLSNIKLFDENVRLPSLHKLDCYDSIDESLWNAKNFPWVKQLRTLTFRRKTSNFKALAVALQGGQLEKLDLSLPVGSLDDWGLLNLPNLVQVSVVLRSMGLSGDPFQWFSRATLPMLQKAEIRVPDAVDVDDMEAVSTHIDTFVQKFPNLRYLSIRQEKMPPAIFRLLFDKVVPQLEELYIWLKSPGIGDILQDPYGLQLTQSEIKWPKLKKLLFRSSDIMRTIKEDTFPFALLEQLASAAHHSPLLSYLDIPVFANISDSSEYEEYEEKQRMQIKFIAEKIVEAKAWPLMKRFRWGKLGLLPSLRAFWPEAEF